MLITVSLIGDDGNPQGYMSRSTKDPKFFHVPRIGESVYIGPGSAFKVIDVFYDSPNLQSIRIDLEPVQEKPWREFLTSVSRGDKGLQKWRWHEGDRSRSE